jgi:hypothetical protein
LIKSNIENVIKKNIEDRKSMKPEFVLGQSVRVISNIDINFPNELNYWCNSKGIIVDMYISGLFSNTWRYDLIHPSNGNICTFELFELDLRSKKKNTIHLNKIKSQEIDILENELLKSISTYKKEEKKWLVEWLDRNYWDFNVNSLNKYRKTLDYNIRNCSETKNFWDFLDIYIGDINNIKNIFIANRRVLSEMKSNDR